MKMSLQTISLIAICVVLVFSVVQAVQIDNIGEQVVAVAQGRAPIDTSDVRIPTQVAPPQMVGGC